MNFKKTIILALSVMLTANLVFAKNGKSFKLKKSLKKQFAFIPKGRVFNGKDTLDINSFYMSKYEVSNKEYNNFLLSLKQQGKINEFKLAQFDSTKWATPLAYNKPLVDYYHNHPAYSNYPVVNISVEGAKLYCEWLTKKINSENPKSEYIITVRLPNRNEWLRAANGNNINQRYAWEGRYLRNSKGLILCNLKIIGDENLFFDTKSNLVNAKEDFSDKNLKCKLNDAADITSPVNSYFPNALGIYNLNGNVAELVTEKVACGGSWQSLGYEVRNLSKVKYENPACTIGFRPILIVTKK